MTAKDALQLDIVCELEITAFEGETLARLGLAEEIGGGSYRLTDKGHFVLGELTGRLLRETRQS